MSNDEIYIEDYPCLCSGGDMCYIVRSPGDEVDISYSTREKAEEALREYNESKS